MGDENLKRMIALADEFFDMKNDPDQLSVNPEIMAKLRASHPATMSEESDENGPIAWMLVFPTTQELMEAFTSGAINEKELLQKTVPGGRYDAIYLCSALVLPEHRGAGLARRLAMHAIQSIRDDHPVRALFYWGFSSEGDALAASIARESGLPLFARKL